MASYSGKFEVWLRSILEETKLCFILFGKTNRQLSCMDLVLNYVFNPCNNLSLFVGADGIQR